MIAFATIAGGLLLGLDFARGGGPDPTHNSETTFESTQATRPTPTASPTMTPEPPPQAWQVPPIVQMAWPIDVEPQAFAISKEGELATTTAAYPLLVRDGQVPDNPFLIDGKWVFATEAGIQVRDMLVLEAESPRLWDVVNVGRTGRLIRLVVELGQGTDEHRLQVYDHWSSFERTDESYEPISLGRDEDVRDVQFGGTGNRRLLMTHSADDDCITRVLDFHGAVIDQHPLASQERCNRSLVAWDAAGHLVQVRGGFQVTLPDGEQARSGRVPLPKSGRSLELSTTADGRTFAIVSSLTLTVLVDVNAFYESVQAGNDGVEAFEPVHHPFDIERLRFIQGDSGASLNDL